MVETRFARLNPVQAHILKLIGLPQPAEFFAPSVLACAYAGEACAWRQYRMVKGPSGCGTATGRMVIGGVATGMAGFHQSFKSVSDRSIA